MNKKNSSVEVQKNEFPEFHNVKKDSKKRKVSPMVNIETIFFDGLGVHHSIELVVRMDVLSEINESCSNLLKTDSSYRNKIYEDVLNMNFRPRINVEKVGHIIVRNLCCVNPLDKVLLENPKGCFKIIMWVHTDYDEWSYVNIYTKESISISGLKSEEQYFEFNDKYDVSITYESISQFFDEEELDFLKTLREVFGTTGETKKMSWSKFVTSLEFVFDELDDDWIFDTLNKLDRYQFIDYREESKTKNGKMVKHDVILTIPETKSFSYLL